MHDIGHVLSEYSGIMYRNIVHLFTLIFIQTAKSMSLQKHSFLLNDKEPEDDIAEFIKSKGYLPNDKVLPQLSIMKNTNDDISYILSKLTDEELIKLLNVEPKKSTYDLNDIVRIALDSKTGKNEKKNNPSVVNEEDIEGVPKLLSTNDKNRYRIKSSANSQTAFHKINHKEIIPQNQKNGGNFLALKKLNNLLLNRPRQLPDDESLTEEKKELLFDILVAQLKTLCCKSTFKKQTYSNNILTDEKLLPKSLDKLQMKSLDQKNNEFMFLILNDEIKNNDDEDLVLVDPNTLERNSSVLILGPVTSPLTNDQLKTVMNRISNELSKPEYTSLLQQLADGTISESNTSIMKNFIYGQETRRYIKAHRCNHKSKLAKVYGGPKWLICTGYLNINTPSLYD